MTTRGRGRRGRRRRRARRRGRREIRPRGYGRRRRFGPRRRRRHHRRPQRARRRGSPNHREQAFVDAAGGGGVLGTPSGSRRDHGREVERERGPLRDVRVHRLLALVDDARRHRQSQFEPHGTRRAVPVARAARVERPRRATEPAGVERALTTPSDDVDGARESVAPPARVDGAAVATHAVSVEFGDALVRRATHPRDVDVPRAARPGRVCRPVETARPRRLAVRPDFGGRALARAGDARALVRTRLPVAKLALVRVARHLGEGRRRRALGRGRVREQRRPRRAPHATHRSTRRAAAALAIAPTLVLPLADLPPRRVDARLGEARARRVRRDADEIRVGVARRNVGDAARRRSLRIDVGGGAVFVSPARVRRHLLPQIVPRGARHVPRPRSAAARRVARAPRRRRPVMIRARLQTARAGSRGGDRRGVVRDAHRVRNHPTFRPDPVRVRRGLIGVRRGGRRVRARRGAGARGGEFRRGGSFGKHPERRRGFSRATPHRARLRALPAARRVARLPLAGDPLVRGTVLPVARALGLGLERGAAALDVVGGFPPETRARHRSVLSPAAARTRTRAPRRGAPLERRAHGRWGRRTRRRGRRRGRGRPRGRGRRRRRKRRRRRRRARRRKRRKRRRRRTRTRRGHGRRRHGRRTRRARRQRRRRGRRAVDVDGVRVGGDAVLGEDDGDDDVRGGGKRVQTRRDHVRAGGRRRGRAVDANGGRRALDGGSEGERGAVVGDVHVVVEGGGCESRGGDGDGEGDRVEEKLEVGESRVRREGVSRDGDDVGARLAVGVAGEGEGDVVGTDGEGLRGGEGVEPATASARGGGGRRDGERGGIVLGGVVEEHLVRAVRHAGGVRQDVGVERGGERRDAAVERERGEPRLGSLRERTTQRRER